MSQETCLLLFLTLHYGGWSEVERSVTFLFHRPERAKNMLNVIVIAAAMWSAVGSGQSLVASRQSTVASGQEKISTLYSTISTLYSPLSTLKRDSTLSEVTISAPKYPEKLARSGKVVSVISAEMIQANQGKSLGELLQQSVGIGVVGARSAPGTNQEIYVRGANTGHVLLLMDGFPLNDPSHIS